MNVISAVLPAKCKKNIKKATTPYKYYINRIDVTDFIMNKVAPPNERFFEVVCR